MNRLDLRVLSLLLALTVALPARATKICLDPGHGGSDPGAVGCGLEEDAINLDTQLKLKALLVNTGLTVVMTRSTDTYVGLSSRSDYANAQGADRFVSIHSNSADPPGTGTETYCAPTGSSNSFDLRGKIQSEMIAAWGLTDRGTKTANFSVLVHTNMPATLSELAFINKCSPDAEYLGSAAHRQQAAEAHLRAILRHLGVTPTQTGTARGAVFEEHGTGSADMTERLPGATVTQTGDTQTARAGDALWGFTLAPGTYTIRASKSGYLDNQLSCTVVASTDAWCSIGLLPVATTTDAAVADTDAAVVDAAASGDAVADAATTVDGNPYNAANVVDDPAENNDEGLGGCACHAPAPTGWSNVTPVLLIGLLLLAHRGAGRRRLLAIAACAIAAQALAQDRTPQAVAVSSSLARLTAVRVVACGDFLAPQLAPSGERVAFSAGNFEGLYVVTSRGGAVQQISDARHAGYLPVWRPDSATIAIRTFQHEFEPIPLTLLDLGGHTIGKHQIHYSVWPVQRDDEIWLQTPSAEIPIARSGDRYFAPQLAPDGRYLVYNGLSTGLYLYRFADGQTLALGAGNHPAFSADGNWLAFDRTSDDGHQLTGGEIFLVDLRAPQPRVAPLTHTLDRIEQYPSLSGDGRHIAFSADATIFVGAIEITE